jgi:PadR family transcriptional regulator, regulatory protein PadR
MDMVRTRDYRFQRAHLCAALLIGGEGAQPIHISGNRVTDSGSLRKLIMDAYNVKTFQIVGLTGSNKVYDIAVKVKGEPTLDEARRMLQAVLMDRFQLKLHREAREFLVYLLVAGKHGPRLTPVKSSATCAASGGGGKGGRPRSGGTVRAEGALPQSWKNVELLSELADRPLDGNYCALYGQDPLVALRVADIRSGSASIFTQVEEKWGLKLEPQVGRSRFWWSITSRGSHPFGRLIDGALPPPIHSPWQSRRVMETKLDLLQGTLDLLILKAVSLGPLHGYGILLRIQQISAERLQIQQGSLYPTLYRLEPRGWIASEWGESENKRRAKYYRLTASGRRVLRAETDYWDKMASVIAAILRTTSEGV